MWVHQEFRISEDGMPEPLTSGRTPLVFGFLAHDPQKDLGAIGMQVAPGQELNPLPLWARYRDMPTSLQHIVNDAMRSGGAEQLSFETAVNCNPGSAFQIIGVFYEGAFIYLFPSEEDARHPSE